MYNIETIKQRINCVDYARRINLQINKSGDRCRSPLRASAQNPTSFYVTDDFFYDFGSASGGDVIDFCAAYAHGGDRGAAIRELATITGVSDDNRRPTDGWVEYTNNLNNRTAFYHQQLNDHDRDYLHSRGLTDDDIDRLMIGRVTDGNLRGRLFLPYFHNGYVCYYATRAMPDGAYPESKYRKQQIDEYCNHVPWGLQTLDRDGDTLVIAEGYFDAASFEAQGYPVLSAITGRFSASQMPLVLSAARTFKRVFVVYDNDKISHAGDGFAASISETLARNGIKFVVGHVPSSWKDISDMYAALAPEKRHEQLQRLIDDATDGLQYYVSTFGPGEFPSLESFMKSICRYIKKTELAELFAYLFKLERFNEKTLKALQDECTKSPAEPTIAEEIIATHDLKFLHGVGFYEYDGRVWNRIVDGVVRGYAYELYGSWATAAKTTAVCKLVADLTLSDCQFDRNPVWNFINGTLELDTGVFRKHCRDDLCSTMAEYPYDPDARCPNWEEFIRTIMDDRAVEMELLQFIPAYVLFQDCPHEKIFVLTGEGANGKTRYTNILERLFAPNVTNTPPIDLTNRFYLISLRDSVLNIAGEIKADISKTEEVLKAVSSGQRIEACYKGKDTINFTPRAKLVFACNGQLSASDTSDGLARRLIIIDFPMRFCEHPTKPNERMADIHLEEKLLPEMSGIFNWVYDGYKLLRKVGYFTQTKQQELLLEDFKRASNPILVFWEDEFAHKPDYISNADLYEMYRQWCYNNGEEMRPSIAFHREFKNVSKEFYTQVRTKTSRGYKLR